MDITFDAETIGLRHKHPDFRVLFNGFLGDECLSQDLEYPTLKSYDNLIGFNLKFDLKCLFQQFPTWDEWPKQLYDTKIAFHLLREDLNSYSLENLAHVLYQYPNYKYLVDFSNSDYVGDIQLLKLYNRHDLYFTKQLKDLTEPVLRKKNKWPLFMMLMDYIKALTTMEMKGVKVDIIELNRQGAIWEVKRNKAAEALRNYGLKVDFESKALIGTNDLRDFFKREKVKLPKTDKGNDCINKNTLKILDHPVANLLLELRQANKQLGTYNIGFKNELIEDIYYPNYSTTGTVTGRLSEKFIQVMPRPETSEFKKCIVSKFPGGKLLSSDWSRLEALLAAEMFWIFTGKHKLADDLVNGYDIHDETLQRFKFLPDRTRAKNANFSTIFGGRGYSLVNEYGFTWPQATEFVHDLIVVRYPEMSEFFEMRGKEISQKGYVEHPYTHRGRHTSNYNEGLNAPIQGIGHDFNKIMTITLAHHLEGFESHVCLDVHDDITVDVCPKEEKEVIDIVKTVYNDFDLYFHNYFDIELKVKYNAEHKIGNNLYSLTKIDT